MGKENFPQVLDFIKTKSKGSQEAHEAIRPAGKSFKEPGKSGLKDKELALY